MRQRRWPGVSGGICLMPARRTPGHIGSHMDERALGLHARTDVYGSPKQARARSVPKERLGRARACG
jgi:hypothetical protein